MNKINENELKKLLKLARLKIDENDLAVYLKHLTNVLEFTSIINKIDTENVNIMTHVWDNALRLRFDQIVEIEQRDLLQSNAECVEDGFYLVPKVIESRETKN